MKQLMLFLTLLVFALTPVAAQVQIDTGLTPSPTATDVIDSERAAVKLASYLLDTQGVDSCVAGEVGEGALAQVVTACVFYDPIDPRLIFMAAIGAHFTGKGSIYVLRDGGLFHSATPDSNEPALVFASNLPDGEYEVVFIWEGARDEYSTAFYFWIDEQKEDSD